MTAEKKKVSEIGEIGVIFEGSERIITGEIPMYSGDEIAESCGGENDAAEMLICLAGKNGCAVHISGHESETGKQISLFRIIYTALGSAKHNKPITAVISSVVLPSELEQVRRNAAKARNALAAENIPFGRLCAGVGIETPSSAILADLLAPMSDFFVFDSENMIKSLKNGCAGTRADRPMNEITDRCLKLTAAAAKREGISVYQVRPAGFNQK